MSEKQTEGAENTDLLSALMGTQGQDALKMIQRMERLKRLMGSTVQQATEPTSPPIEPREEVFGRNRGENLISAAIPFLDKEYQRDFYVMVRLMEMRRMLSGGFLEARNKQEESPILRRRQMLGAMRPYLLQEEQKQVDTLVKVLELKEILEREEMK